jgi:hypothetical protein
VFVEEAGLPICQRQLEQPREKGDDANLSNQVHKNTSPNAKSLDVFGFPKYTDLGIVAV